MNAPLERNSDGSYSAFGRINGRAFISDQSTAVEAQEQRKILGDENTCRFSVDYFHGQRDYLFGLPCKQDQSSEYERGFGAAYQAGEIASFKTELRSQA